MGQIVTRDLYDNRRFRCMANSAGGQTDSRTIFHYRQKGSVVWGTYQGGNVQFGVLLATVSETDALTMCYQQLDETGGLRSGRCSSIPERRSDGVLLVHERWQWDDGGSGESTLVEI